MMQMSKVGGAFVGLWMATWAMGDTIGASSAVTAFIDGNRSNIYNALASIEGALLGFIITAAAILLTLDTPASRLEPFRGSRAHKQLWQTFGNGMWALALATGATVLALVFDTDRSPRWWATSVALAGVMMAVYHVMFCVLRLEQTIQLVTRPTVKREPGE